MLIKSYVLTTIPETTNKLFLPSTLWLHHFSSDLLCTITLWTKWLVHSRGAIMMKEANWNFFQVSMHSRNRKQNAYTSMRLSNNDDFKSLLSMAKTPEEKNMAYFLLAYNDFGNPVPLMEKMLANNAQSEILKVLAARAINQMEQAILPTYPYCYDQECDKIKDKRLPLYFKTYYKEAQDYSKQLEQFVVKPNKPQDEF